MTTGQRVKMKGFGINVRNFHVDKYLEVILISPLPRAPLLSLAWIVSQTILSSADMLSFFTSRKIV